MDTAMQLDDGPFANLEEFLSDGLWDVEANRNEISPRLDTLPDWDPDFILSLALRDSPRLSEECKAPESQMTTPFDNNPLPRSRTQDTFAGNEQPAVTSLEYSLRESRVATSMALPQGHHTAGCLDLESDATWEAINEEELWSSRLRSELFSFRSSETVGATMVTEPLSSDKRRKMHSMCHLMSLSHMSFSNTGDTTVRGGLKRVLIARCAIVPTSTSVSMARVWNPPRMLWNPGFVNPFAVAIVGDWFLERESASYARSRSLMERIEREGLPVPIYVEEPRSEVDSRTIAIMHYNNAGSAHAIVTSQFWNRFETGEGGLSKLKSTFIQDAYYHQMTAKDTEPSTVRPNDVDLRAGEDQHEYATTYETAERSSTTTSHISKSSASESSASSDYSFVSGYDATGNRTRKRKRVGGFVCHAASCLMVFDRECDRRKHEKVHSEERAHVCPECNKGFHWPKDLRRRERRHHAAFSDFTLFRA